MDLHPDLVYWHDIKTKGSSLLGPKGDEGTLLWVPKGKEDLRKIHNNYVAYQNMFFTLLNFKIKHGYLIEWEEENKSYTQLCKDIEEIRAKISEKHQ